MQSELLRLANMYFPGGGFGVNVPENLRTVMVRGQGSRMHDANGKEYIDYLLGSGPLLVGHAHPEVVDAVQRQSASSSTFYMLNEPAIRLAQKVVEAAACGDSLRYVLSGTDATFSALRIARAATGRNLVIKFEGHSTARTTWRRSRSRSRRMSADRLAFATRLVSRPRWPGKSWSRSSTTWNPSPRLSKLADMRSRRSSSSRSNAFWCRGPDSCRGCVRSRRNTGSC